MILLVRLVNPGCELQREVHGNAVVQDETKQSISQDTSPPQLATRCSCWQTKRPNTGILTVRTCACVPNPQVAEQVPILDQDDSAHELAHV
jgi:hypothetical protein